MSEELTRFRNSMPEHSARLDNERNAKDTSSLEQKVEEINQTHQKVLEVLDRNEMDEDMISYLRDSSMSLNDVVGLFMEKPTSIIKSAIKLRPDITTMSDLKIFINQVFDAQVQEARARLREEDIYTNYLRLTAIPFRDEVAEFVRSHEKVYVIEMNHDGQMRQLLQLEMPDQAVKLRSIRKNDGLPLSAGWITRAILQAEGE